MEIAALMIILSVFIPIQGLIWLGMRAENRRRKEILQAISVRLVQKRGGKY